MWHIYKITNKITNECYIGQTRKDNPLSRWKQHLQSSKKGKVKLYVAMREYGVENFDFELLESKEFKYKEELDVLEANYIKQYDSYTNGYNSDEGNNTDNNAEYKLIGRRLDDVIQYLKSLAVKKHYFVDKKNVEFINLLKLIASSEQIKIFTNIYITIDNNFGDTMFYIDDYADFMKRSENYLKEFYI